MIKVGLTGGIGSGKTYVATVFKQLGVPVFYADEMGKKALTQSTLKEKIVSCFGKDILDNSNTIDTKKLAAIVFSNPQALKQLTSITHTYIHQQFFLFAEAHIQEPYIIIEAAILFEYNFDAWVDSVIMVSAPESIRIERVKQRDSLDLETIKNRMNQQFTEQLIRYKADYEIVNDEQHGLVSQVLNLHQVFINRNKNKSNSI